MCLRSMIKTGRFCKKGYKIIDMNSVVARSVLFGWNAPCLVVCAVYDSIDQIFYFLIVLFHMKTNVSGIENRKCVQ